MQTQSGIEELVEKNKQLIQKIYNTIVHNIHYYISHKVFNERRIADRGVVSIVLPTCGNIQLTQLLLKQIASSAYKNVQVVLVDDSDDIFDDKYLDSYPCRIDYVKINRAKRDWVNTCINYNIGLTFAKGEHIIIQNPYVFHVGDVISHTRTNCLAGKYTVYDVIASRSHAASNAVIALEAIKALTYASIEKLITNKSDYKWYQHSVRRQQGSHFLTAIHRDDLAKLNNQFDYDLALGHWYDDSEFIYRITHILELEIVNVPSETTKIIGLCAYNDTMHKSNVGNIEYNKAISINRFIYKQKLLHFEKMRDSEKSGALEKTEALSSPNIRLTENQRKWISYHDHKKPDSIITDQSTFIFMEDFFAPEFTAQKYYAIISTFLRKILHANGYKTLSKYRMDSQFGTPKVMTKQTIDSFFKGYTSDQIFVFNSVDFCMFYVGALVGTIQFSDIVQYLPKINYIIICWQEVLTSDFYVVGYEKIPGFQEYLLAFFRNSKLNIVSNQCSLDSLLSANINQSIYKTVSGYSEINDLVAFKETNTEKPIDVLIYCTLHESYTYRMSMVEKLKEINKQNNNKYNIVISGDLYGDELDDHLRKAKMVAHIPAFADMVHMPWAKITYLQVRKVFFIIEDNDEMYTKPEYAHIPYYIHHNAQGLYDQIQHYMEHPEKMPAIVEKNHAFIKANSNLDIILPEMIKGILDPCHV